MTVAELAARPGVRDRFVAAWRARGGPWCDDCDGPAVRVPGVGWRHATPEEPLGVLDDTGHRVTVRILLGVVGSDAPARGAVRSLPGPVQCTSAVAR